MGKYLFKISTKLKDEIKDPQGQVIEKISKRLKISDKINVRVGKYYEIIIFASSLDEAKMMIKKVAENILSNPIVELYTILSFEEII